MRMRLLSAALAALASVASADYVRVATPAGGGTLVDGVTSSWMSADGRWAIYSSRSALLVEGDDVDTNDVFAYSTFDGVTRRLSVHPDSGVPAPGGCRFHSASLDARFVAMDCSNSGWASNPTFPTAGYSQSYILDRDVDRDGVFDEAGATRIVSVMADADSLPLPDIYLSKFAISANGRFVVVTNSIDKIDGASCNSGVWYRDRDPDDDGVFDEPGGVGFACIPGTVILSPIKLFVSNDGASIVFQGRTNLHPTWPSHGLDNIWSVALPSGTVSLLGLDLDGARLDGRVTLVDASADVNSLLIDVRPSLAQPSELADGAVNTYIFDRTDGTWTAPLAQVASRTSHMDISLGVDLDSTGTLVMFRAAAVTGWPPVTQYYLWRRGEPEYRRVLGYRDGRLLERVQSWTWISDDGERFLVATNDSRLVPQPLSRSEGSDLLLFDDEFDVGAEFGPLYTTAEKEMGLGVPFTLELTPSEGGTAASPPADIEVGPLDAFSIDSVPDECEIEAEFVRCRGIRSNSLEWGEFTSISLRLTPMVAGDTTIFLTTTTAEPDANLANDVLARTYRVLPTIDLAITAIGTPSTPAVGERARISLYVANNSTSMATAIEIVATLPPAIFPYADASAQVPAGNGSCTISLVGNRDELRCQFPSLAPGDLNSAILEFTPLSSGVYSARFDVSSSESLDNVLANQSAIGLVTAQAPTGGGGGSGGSGGGGGGGHSDSVFLLITLLAVIRRDREFPGR